MADRLYQGNCLDVMRDLNSASIDTIITDPPYGLSFMGKKWDYDVPSEEIWSECLRVLKPGGTALIFAGSRTQHRMAVRVEDAGFILKDTIMWLYGSGFPKATDISKQLDKGHERKVVGQSINSFNRKAGGIFVGENEGERNITEPATAEAKLWNGWKSHGLKPAYEPILVCMKPNDGTYANNALTWGVSGLNIDGGRIGTDKWEHKASKISPYKSERIWDTKGNTPDIDRSGTGRFPANIILDEEAGEMLDEQSGITKSTGGKSGHTKAYQGGYKQEYYGNTKPGLGDKGGASRFFYCAKASKSERNAGGRNSHPTVKPLKLMEYLCILTKTPTGGVVLDPFMGSGTTGVACKNAGRDFIGIEMNEDYFNIAKERINNG